MKKRKVLILPADFYPSNTGFSNATLNLINAIEENNKNIEIHVFTTVSLNGKREINGAKVIRYKEKFYNRSIFIVLANYAKFQFLKEYIYKNKIDFILLETNTFTILQSLLCKHFKDKLAVRIHSTADTEVLMYHKRRNLFGKIQRRIDIDFMKKVKYIISTNNYHSAFIKKIMFEGNVYTIWADKEYFILPNTITVNNANDDNHFYSQNYLLTLGKLSFNGYVQKGLQDLLKAIYVLKTNNNIPSNFKLKLVGDGEMRSNLLEYASRLGVNGHIDFIKKIEHDETLDLIKNAKAVILLSRYEGQSMFITEALALGKPIIITANNGMKDMIIDGKNGIKVKEGDYVEASEAIKKIYAMNEKEVSNMGKESEKIYLEKYLPQTICRTFTDILEMIVPTNQ